MRTFILFLACLLLYVASSFADDTTKVFDNQNNLRGYVKGGTVYDTNWNKKYTIKDDNIYDTQQHKVGHVERSGGRHHR